MRRALIALSLLASIPAHANAQPVDDGGTPPTEDVETYPLRIIAADAGALSAFAIGGMMFFAAAFGSDTETEGTIFITAGVVSYAATAPLLHLRRGNPRGAMRSAIARAGLPLVGASLVYLTDRQGDPDRPIYGAVAGIGLAMVLDWTVFARMPAGTTATPFVAPSADGGVHAGIAGSF